MPIPSHESNLLALMRSKAFSIFLLILAFTCGGLAFVQITRNDLTSIFGQKALPQGSRVLMVDPNQVRAVTITSGGKTRRYEEAQGQWIFRNQSEPDRADYQALEALLACLSNLTVLESFPATDENLKRMGLASPIASIALRVLDEPEEVSLGLGKKGAWHLQVPGANEQSPPVDYPSLYFRAKDDDFIYLCSSPYIEDMLANGFGSHRDLRPFFFPPELLAEVTISKPNGDLTLSRNSPFGAWAIEKPFQLEANPKGVGRLIGGLYQLTAREARNKPAPAAQDPEIKLSLRFFGRDGTRQKDAVTLALSPPATNQEDIYYGRLDDWRKDIEFTFSKTGTDTLPGLQDLPMTLDELRSTHLSGLDLTKLKSMTITGTDLKGPLEIFIEKSPISGEWRAQRSYLGEKSEANEGTFFTVKKAFTEEEAIATAADSAEDLSLYGLDYPAKSVTLTLFDGSSETVHFGLKTDPEGIPHYYFRRDGSRLVMEINSEAFFKIAARPYLWRGAKVWNFDVFDLSLLQIERPGEDPLVLSYSDLSQTWSAQQGTRDVTALLNENRANRYLETLETLQVTQWLDRDHSSSQVALSSPVFSVTAVFKKPDDPDAPIITKVLELAGASTSGENRFYFGRVKGQPHTFIIDLAAVNKLATPLLEEE